MGHKEILNSRFWKASNECWMCEKWRYSLIFWDAKQTHEFQIQDSGLEELLQNLIMQSNVNIEHAFEKQQVKMPYSGQPYILGTFTDWQPRRMMTVGEFCAIISNDTKIINSTDLEELEQYNSETVEHLDSILQENQPYPDAQKFGLLSQQRK